MKVNNIFFNLRKQKKITQLQLANFLGVNKTAVSKWECGETIPSHNQLIALANYYNVTIDELLGRTAPAALFDDARVPKTEIQELFDNLDFASQRMLIGYAKGLAERNNTIKSDQNMFLL